MLPFVLGNQPFQLPTCWEDISLGKYLDLHRLAVEGRTEFHQILSVLIGIPEEDLQQCPEIDLDRRLSPHLAFLQTPVIASSIPKPENIVIDGNSYPVPSDLSLETWGQALFLDEALQRSYKETGDVIRAIPEALAIYFYPVVSGKPFLIKEAREFVNVIRDNVSFLDGYPVGAFFLRTYIEFKRRHAVQN